MKIIGLCGGSGSGKGRVCDIFRENNIPTIDTDAVYREMTSQKSSCLDALKEEFGKEIITESGSLNRVKLAEIVFSGEDSPKKREKLNQISHKFILDETRLRLEKFRNCGAVAAVVDAPVLFESGFDSECDYVVCVIAEREARIERIMKRDSLSREAAEKRISAQLSDEETISRSDFAIYNNSDLETLRREVNSVITKILEI